MKNNKNTRSAINFQNIFFLYGVICLLFACFVIFCMIVDCGNDSECSSLLTPLGIYIFLGSTLIVATFRDYCFDNTLNNNPILISTLLPFSIILGCIPFFAVTDLNCIECFLLSTSSLCNTCIKVPDIIRQNFPDCILIWRSLLQLFGAIIFIVFLSKIFYKHNSDYYKQYMVPLKSISDINICNSIKKKMFGTISVYSLLIFFGIIVLNVFCEISVIDAFCYTSALITSSGTDIDYTFYIISNNLFFLLTCLALLTAVFPVQYMLFQHKYNNSLSQIDKIFIYRYLKVITTFVVVLLLYNFMKDSLSFNSFKIDIVDCLMALSTNEINHSTTEFITCILFCLSIFGGILGSASGGLKLDRFLRILKYNSKEENHTANYVVIWLWILSVFLFSCSCILAVLNIGLQHAILLVLKCILNIGLSLEESSRIFSDKNIICNLIVILTMIIGRCGFLITCYFISINRKSIKEK